MTPILCMKVHTKIVRVPAFFGTIKLNVATYFVLKCMIFWKQINFAKLCSLLVIRMKMTRNYNLQCHWIRSGLEAYNARPLKDFEATIWYVHLKNISFELKFRVSPETLKLPLRTVNPERIIVEKQWRPCPVNQQL